MKNKKEYISYKNRLNIIYDESIKRVEQDQSAYDKKKSAEIKALKKDRNANFKKYETEIEKIDKEKKSKLKDAKNLCKIGEQPPEQELERLRRVQFPDCEVKKQLKEVPTYMTANQLTCMQRQRRNLPRYTMGEEVFNSVTHIVGGGLGVVALVVGVVFANIYKTPGAAWLMAIFGIAIIVLYTMSAIYHGLPVGKGKQVFQIIDHCTIYMMIAGSYVPLCFIALKDTYPLNVIIFSIVLALSILGVVLNATMMRRKWVKVLSNILYIVIGWAIITMYSYLVQSIGLTGTWFIVGGGIAYTIGSILYGIGHNTKWFHSVFHLFVLAGTILQFLGVLLYAIIGL